MPPGFCARLTSAAPTAQSRLPAASSRRPFRAIAPPIPAGGGLPSRFARIVAGGGLFVEPDVFHPVAVVDAVDHRHEPLDIRLRAGPATRVEDDRAGAILGQPPLD